MHRRKLDAAGPYKASYGTETQPFSSVLPAQRSQSCVTTKSGRHETVVSTRISTGSSHVADEKCIPYCARKRSLERPRCRCKDNTETNRMGRGCERVL